MKTRTHTSIQSRKSEINPHVWTVFVMIIAPLFGLSVSMSYGGIGFIIGTTLFLGVLLIYKYFSNRKKSYYFYYTSTKAYDLPAIQNAMNHNNYYRDEKLNKAFQKKLWKEIYYDKYLGHLGLITFIIIAYFTLTIGVGESYFKTLNDITVLILFFFIPMGSLVWGHFHYKHKYQSIIKNPRNRTILENIHGKKFFFVKQRNNIGGEDLIFWNK